MLNPDRFPSILFRSWRSSLRALGASAGILALAFTICISVHHVSNATATDSRPLAANMVQSATDLNWRQSPSSVLNSPGRNSVTLDPCPPGVIAVEPSYYVYISGFGTQKPCWLRAAHAKEMGDQAHWSLLLQIRILLAT